MLKPAFHSLEVRACGPCEQRGLQPAAPQRRAWQAGTQASRVMLTCASHTFTHTHTAHTSCCAKCLESGSEGALRSAPSGREESRAQQTLSETKCPNDHRSKLRRPVLAWGLNTVIWGVGKRCYIHIYTHTHMTHRTKEGGFVHVTINPVSQSVTQPSPVKSFWPLTLKNNRNHESCIELIRNVNNAKPKACVSYC